MEIEAQKRVRAMKRRAAQRDSLIMGDDMGDRVKNAGRCAMEKVVGEHFILTEKP